MRYLFQKAYNLSFYFFFKRVCYISVGGCPKSTDVMQAERRERWHVATETKDIPSKAKIKQPGQRQDRQRLNTRTNDFISTFVLFMEHWCKGHLQSSVTGCLKGSSLPLFRAACHRQKQDQTWQTNQKRTLPVIKLTIPRKLWRCASCSGRSHAPQINLVHVHARQPHSYPHTQADLWSLRHICPTCI